MKHSIILSETKRRSLTLVGLLFLASASTTQANQIKHDIEPLCMLPKQASEHTAYLQELPVILLAQAASSKAEAANIAKSRHGGKVLSVRKSGKGWKVKLLKDDGRVKLVQVEGKGSGK